MVTKHAVHTALKSIDLDRLGSDYALGGGLQHEVSYLYDRVAWLRRAVDVRSQAVSSLPHCVYEGEHLLSTEAGVNEEGGYEIIPKFNIPRFLEDCEADVVLYGAFYFEPLRGSRTGTLKGFKRCHPRSITPNFDPITGELKNFTRNTGAIQTTYAPNELGYIWLPNRAGETGAGRSLAFTALQSAKVLWAMDAYNQAYFERGAINPTIVSIPSFDRATDEEQARVKNWFERMIGGGLRSAFKTLPLASEVTVNQLGSAIGELAVPELTTTQRENIATALGIPQSILFSNATNFATAQADDFHFYDKTIVPEARWLQAELKIQLFQKFGLSQYDFRFEPDRHPVYQVVQAERARTISLLVGTDTKAVGVISQNEARAMMGYDPIEATMYQPEPEPEPQAEPQAEPEAVIERDDEDAPVQKYLDDLATWQRYATKRIKEGRAVKAMQFNSDLPKPVHAMIVNALKDCEDVLEVKRIFEDVRGYLCHNS